MKLPANVRLQGRTVNGGIKTASLGGPADLATVNGSIQVDSAAEVRAKTVNGSVTAKMDRTDWKGELELTTVNGSVKVELPASANTEVKGGTVNGSIDSDFGLPVEGKWGPKQRIGQDWRGRAAAEGELGQRQPAAAQAQLIPGAERRPAPPGALAFPTGPW